MTVLRREDQDTLATLRTAGVEALLWEFTSAPWRVDALGLWRPDLLNNPERSFNPGGDEPYWVQQAYENTLDPEYLRVGNEVNAPWLLGTGGLPSRGELYAACHALMVYALDGDPYPDEMSGFGVLNLRTGVLTLHGRYPISALAIMSTFAVVKDLTLESGQSAWLDTLTRILKGQ